MKAGEQRDNERREPVARRFAVLTVAALLGALGTLASAASAEPLSMTFTEARANVGVQLSDAALFEAPDLAELKAQVGPAGESITGGELDVPDFSTHITAPIDADVTVVFDYPAVAGAFVAASGELTLSGAVSATLNATGKQCTVSTTPEILTLSTNGNSGGANPRSGERFVHGLTGAGSIAGQWTDMQATPVDPSPGGDTVFCEDVEKQIGGPGGIWLRQAGDLAPPAAPQLTGTDPASPGASGTPRIRGSAEAGSTVQIYAGPGCKGVAIASGSAEELGSPGIVVGAHENVNDDVGLIFEYSATATDAAGNTSPCSTSISYVRRQGSGTCIVPRLTGKKLKAARKKITAAGCVLGDVRRPKFKVRKGKVSLVVKSSNPGEGFVSETGKVDLRLGPKLRKSRR